MQKVEELFRTISKHRKHKNQLVAFREPSAQHFEAKGGDKSFLNKSSKECTPLDENEIDLAKWRDQAVKEGAKAASYKLIEMKSSNNKTKQQKYPHIKHDESSQQQELVVLPFFDFTKPYYSMHPTGYGGADCHHFCSSPYFYVPIWRSLRLAIDRQYYGGKLGRPRSSHDKKKGLFGGGH